MHERLKISNIGRLVTMEPGPGREGALGVIAGAALLIEGGRIAWLGRAAEFPSGVEVDREIDAGGRAVLPGLVDCHTHLVHAGTRQHELNLRSQGKSYQEIAAAGGGIASTVAATRKATAEELFGSARTRAMEALGRGITTIEVKTGYGLDAQSEAKMVEVIGRLRDELPVRILGTMLAHIVPQEFCERRTEYLQLWLGKMLVAAARSGVVEACDCFVEEGAFTKNEARAVIGAGKVLGLSGHLHVDQFRDGGGASLAAELRVLSADHLDHASEKGMKAMAAAGVVGVVLPGASLFAGKGRYPDARRMIDHGVRVAISTDHNPGTSPTLDLWLMATIAAAQMGMTCDEALLGITRNAALALGLPDEGRIAVGAPADLIILDADDEHLPLYRFGTNLVHQVFTAGEPVCQRDPRD